MAVAYTRSLFLFDSQRFTIVQEGLMKSPHTVITEVQRETH